MASSLHYVTPLQLSDTFNEWFLRSNSLIDVVNKINVYNVDTGWGLAKYRSVDGTTLIRLNIGGEENEYDASGGVSGDWDYGLKFVHDPGSTGSVNPDVSSNRRILTLDFDNLVGASGGISGASVMEGDMFAYSDSTDGQKRVKKVSAANMLPYGISGDHRFYGNIYFDGTNTTINSSELWIDDKNITLATSNTGDSTGGYLNDVLLDGAGIIIKGASGDKEFVYEYTQTAGATYHAFKSNIDLMFGSSTKGLVEDKSLDFFSLVNDDFDVSFSQLASEDKLWKIRKSKIGDAQSRLIFFFENTTSGSTVDALTLTKAGTVQIGNLEGGTTLDGVYHESTFSYLPASYSVPTTGVSGDTTLHYKWGNRKTVTQIGHGFSSGQLLRHYPYGTTYAYADNSSKENAEVIAIVENHAPGASHDQFVACYSGLVDLSTWIPNASGASWGASDGTTMDKGQIYFLTGASGGFTATAPDITGMIKKPVLLAVDEREALFVNYLGHEVSTGDVETGTTGSYAFTNDDGYLVLNDSIPSQGHKNKLINGDFSFWQRSEFGGANAVGSLAHGASDYVGATGARFINASGILQYTADMWALDTRHYGTNAEVQKHGHTAGISPQHNNFFTSAPQGSYVRVLNNTIGTTTSEVSYFTQRIEDVNTFAPVSGTNTATVSYWARGASAGAITTWPMRVSLWQVYDGNSGGADSTGDYGGGATMCIGVAVTEGQYQGATSATGGSVELGTSWAKQTHTYIVPNATTMTGGAGEIDPVYNFVELRFEVPTEWGRSGGVDLARVQLEAGINNTDWDERPIQTEENLVNRYYQVHAVGTRGYAPDAGVVGGIQQWKTIPYPYYGHTPHSVNLISKCVSAKDIIDASNTVAAAAVGDIKGATAGMGFAFERTADEANMVAAYTNYHFDFSIYDGN
jgi:hypothetical protein